MAVPTNKSGYASPGVIIWRLTDTDGTGLPMNRSLAPDKTVQVGGTFNSGTVTIQGTNDDPKKDIPTQWDTLHNPLGTVLTFTTARIDAIMENPLFIRAIMTGTVGAAAVKVTICNKGFNA